MEMYSILYNRKTKDTKVLKSNNNNSGTKNTPDIMFIRLSVVIPNIKLRIVENEYTDYTTECTEEIKFSALVIPAQQSKWKLVLNEKLVGDENSMKSVSLFNSAIVHVELSNC